MKRRFFSDKRKAVILADAKATSPTEAAKRAKVDVSLIFKWRRSGNGVTANGKTLATNEHPRGDVYDFDAAIKQRQDEMVEEAGGVVLKFRRDSDEETCGNAVREKGIIVICMRRLGHRGRCIAMACEAFEADDVCSCREPIGGPHRLDCDSLYAAEQALSDFVMRCDRLRDSDEPM